MSNNIRQKFVRFLIDEGIWDKLTNNDKKKVHNNEPIFGEGTPYGVDDNILGLFPDGSYKEKNDMLKINNLFYKGLHDRVYNLPRDDWFKYPEKFLKSSFKPDNDMEYQPSFQAELDSSHYTDLLTITREAFDLFLENGRVIEPKGTTIEDIILNSYEVNNETIPFFYNLFGVCLVDPYNFNSFEEYLEFVQKNKYKDFDYNRLLMIDSIISEEEMNAIYLMNNGRIGKQSSDSEIQTLKQAVEFLSTHDDSHTHVNNLLMYFLAHRKNKIDICRCLNTIFDTYNPFYKNELIIMEHLTNGEQ